MQVSVVVDGIEHSITPTAGDLVRLEREYGLRATQLDDESVSVEHILFLCWVALRRQKQLDQAISFDDFLDLADVPQAVPLDPPAPLPQT